jgi:medium-chain acyl-[acyl-carrier-protein] hydrolase
MDLLLPTLRADFEAVEGYRYISNDPALDCAIVALGGLDDPRVSRERMEGWAQHTNMIFKSQHFPGDHFFIHTARGAVLATLTAELSALHEKH